MRKLTPEACAEILKNLPSGVVPPSDKLLAKGHAGKRVERLQRSLQRLGIQLTEYGVDGIFGDETESALRSFQQRSGILVDGVYGPNTESAMLEAFTKLDDKHWREAAERTGSVYSEGFRGRVKGLANRYSVGKYFERYEKENGTRPVPPNSTGGSNA
ncbi:peptidoglycan-binding protein [Streptomonospora sp. PA3]|uniref:peptidoglycan-binding domain-containing protein n=1 Tax=Streptomonospora sp. PA3 TaxID=2607326 RepID=UPI0012DED4B8|nr:peptidoglycan-binding protein [Streptomonospora sp. PA3]MUL40391.1 peptidoglycan-binding protein [Streptomonospora sp. PA3]